MSGDWPAERLWTNNVDTVSAELLNQEIRDRMRLLGGLSWSIYTPEMYNWTSDWSTPSATKGWIQGYYSEYGDLVRFFIVGNMTTDEASPVDAYSMGWTLPSPTVAPGVLQGQFVNYIDQGIANTYTQAFNNAGSPAGIATNYSRISAQIGQVGASAYMNDHLAWPDSITFMAYWENITNYYSITQTLLDDWNNSTYESYYICSGEYIRSRDDI